MQDLPSWCVTHDMTRSAPLIITHSSNMPSLMPMPAWFLTRMGFNSEPIRAFSMYTYRLYTDQATTNLRRGGNAVSAPVKAPCPGSPTQDHSLTEVQAPVTWQESRRTSKFTIHRKGVAHGHATPDCMCLAAHQLDAYTRSHTIKLALLHLLVAMFGTAQCNCIDSLL